MSIRERPTASIDPTGPLPPADDNGRLILNAIKTSLAIPAITAFIFSAVSLVSLLYWVIYFESGNPPGIPNPIFAAILKFGLVLLPFLPFLFGELLLPPRLTITAAGLSLRHRSGNKTLLWRDVVEINLQQRTTRDRYGAVASRTQCRVFSNRGARIIIEPVFNVSPTALAAYLQTRGQETGAKITTTQTPSPAIPPHVRVQLTILAILAAFAIAIVLTAYGIMRHSGT